VTGCAVVGSAAKRKRGGRGRKRLLLGRPLRVVSVRLSAFSFSGFEEPAASVRTWFHACMTGGAEGREVASLAQELRIFGLGRWVFNESC
jgi:hypothetical protein